MELPGSTTTSPGSLTSPTGRTSPSGRQSPNAESSVEKEAGKPEVNPDDSLLELNAEDSVPAVLKIEDSVEIEDSVPAGWKIEKFASDLDLLLTSPQVIESYKNLSCSLTF